MKKLILIAILIIAVVMIILGFKNSEEKYEYYDFNNTRGTSSKCSSKELVECKIKGKMVEVKQYSELSYEK